MQSSAPVAYASLPSTSAPCGSVVFIGTYPPTQCGLATFTANLHEAVNEVNPGRRAKVIRLVDRGPTGEPPSPFVTATWRAEDRVSREHAISVASTFDLVVVQHEFGIFGGPDGIEVLELMARCSAPIVTVLHTVLPQPSASQRAILEAVCRRSVAIVTQSAAARRRLLEVYDVDSAKLNVIPHGAAPNIRGPRDESSLETVLTWGLIGPGKGLEHGIVAMSRLQARGIEGVRYVIAGQTHPKVREHNGEAYREGLIGLANRLGVGSIVLFDDAYRDWDSLRHLVRSADVVLLPYDSREQVTSGVLVEALASGKPVVATAFPHAVEALAGGAGLVVPHEEPSAMATALERVLFEPGLHESMSFAARREAASLAWPAVAKAYDEFFGSIIVRRAIA